MDSVPLVIITGQVPTHAIGQDAFQECDTVGITRPCVKHNILVKDIRDLAPAMRKAFFIAQSGRPGPVLVDIPKDITIAKALFSYPRDMAMRSYNPVVKGHAGQIKKAVQLLLAAERPMVYTGGGVILSDSSDLLNKLVNLLGYPCTNTLMGLGGFKATDPKFVGMLGMHGTYEANMAMHDCDVMLACGSRFDDRVTGRVAAFSPQSKKIHIDIDASSINKNVMVHRPIIGDVAHVMEDFLDVWHQRNYKLSLEPWWMQIAHWREKKSLAFTQNGSVIKPQYAISRLCALTENHETYITTEVGQHQMWAAQHYDFKHPNRWMTSGGLGTMGYGLPAAMGVQIAHPDAHVIDIAGEASILMNIQEMATLAQYRLPVKIFIINNRWMGMVRQWQELLHGGRYSESYSESLPDFVRLAEAFGAVGLRVEDPAKVDDTIAEMLSVKRPVIVDVCVDPKENCYPMIPSGAGHNEMILASGDENDTISEEGKVLV
jgi:acetolactate synthase-1/2/3 large subunit